MVNQKIIFLLLSISLLCTNYAVSQNGGYAGASFGLGYGPRGMAISNAMAASTFEGIYPYYNPALAAFKATGNQVDLSVSSLSFDRVYQTFSSTFQLPTNAGLSIGLIKSGVKAFDERSVSGYPLGNFDIAEYQLINSFGLRFSERFWGGISFKLSYANYNKEISPSTALGIDIGILYRFGNYLNFAFTVQDFFANYTWNSGELYNQTQSRNVINNFPITIKWAFSYQRDKYAIQTEYELQSVEYEYENKELFIDDNGFPNQINQLMTTTNSSGTYKFGATWNMHERFTLRSGYRIIESNTSNKGLLSFGFSTHLPIEKFSPSIDYAFVKEPNGISNIHVFALRLHL
jgi:hypothetical protein